MTQEEINQMTGASQGASLPKYKAIRADGKKGGFVITDLTKKEGDSYPQETLFDPIEVVFLKVRRRLMQGSQSDGVVKYTTEHDTPNDVVTLFIKEGNKRIQGVASELREQYPELKTEEIVYVRWKGEVCKLSAKGLSLNPEAGNFFGYISEHTDFYKYKTIVTVKKGEEYWHMAFQKGSNLTDEQVAEVLEQLKSIHEECERVKNAYTPNTPIAPITTTPAGHADLPDSVKEAQEITPDDIPF